MDDRYVLQQEDLVENPTARVPICLVLDVSSSMAGAPINELNEGVKLFFQAIREDEVAQYAAEISIVTFGDTVTKKLDFMSVERQEVPTLYASGSTPMGAGVTLALDLLEARKEDYKRAGVDYYQPWMVVMTDGAPTDDIGVAAGRIGTLVAEKKLTVFPIAIGEGANTGVLAKLSPTRPPLRLQGLNFREAVELDVNGIQAWGKV